MFISTVAMKKSRYFLFLAFILPALVFGNARRVQATLGEAADSVESDRTALSAVRQSTTSVDGYSIHEIRSEAVTVREYVSASGVVFAIVWKGLIRPDLKHLLGSYASEYEKALEQTPTQKGSRRLKVKTSRIIVEKWGHMRSLQGRAYVPALIPVGVSVDDIK